MYENVALSSNPNQLALELSNRRIWVIAMCVYGFRPVCCMLSNKMRHTCRKLPHARITHHTYTPVPWMGWGYCSKYCSCGAKLSASTLSLPHSNVCKPNARTYWSGNGWLHSHLMRCCFAFWIESSTLLCCGTHTHSGRSMKPYYRADNQPSSGPCMSAYLPTSYVCISVL